MSDFPRTTLEAERQEVNAIANEMIANVEAFRAMALSALERGEEVRLAGGEARVTWQYRPEGPSLLVESSRPITQKETE